jgi:hypothetical protein
LPALIFSGILLVGFELFLTDAISQKSSRKIPKTFRLLLAEGFAGCEPSAVSQILRNEKLAAGS